MGCINTVRLTRLAAVAAIVAATATTGGVAAAAEPSTEQDEYVNFLQARAESSEPYSQSEAYVRTLVYWHNHPNWGFGE